MNNNEMDVTVGDVVQISPFDPSNPMFGGCFMVVTELKSWGVQGYVQALGKDGEPGGQAYYRAKWDEIEYAGKAMWMVKSDAPDDDASQD